MENTVSTALGVQVSTGLDFQNLETNYILYLWRDILTLPLHLVQKKVKIQKLNDQRFTFPGELSR